MKEKRITWSEFMHEEAVERDKKIDLKPIFLSKVSTVKLTFTHKTAIKDVIEIEDVKPREKKGCNIL